MGKTQGLVIGAFLRDSLFAILNSAIWVDYGNYSNTLPLS